MDRALDAARRAHAALLAGSPRNAAWWSLYGCELDSGCGLAVAMVARTLAAVRADPLATLGTRHALQLGVPEPERADIEREHRADRWSRGLLAHTSGEAVLPWAAFSQPESFDVTGEHDPWFEERYARWGSPKSATRALIRLVGALSDALEKPDGGAESLRSETPWPDMPAYAAWKAERPLEDAPPAVELRPDPDDALILSDHWSRIELERLEEAGQLAAAADRAERWKDLRPGQLAPLLALLRIAEATGQAAAAEALEAEILAETGERDLDELEEARLELGALGRFGAQLAVLDRMDALAPGHPVILANRGAARLEVGDTSGAEGDLSLALALDPKSGPALANLAVLRMQEGDFGVARGLLEQAKALHPDEPAVRHDLALCLEAQGHRDLALAEARAAAALMPGWDGAEALLSRLEG